MLNIFPRISGGAFEDRVGTYLPEQNRFALPPEIEKKLRRGADPLKILEKMEEAASVVKEVGELSFNAVT